MRRIRVQRNPFLLLRTVSLGAVLTLTIFADGNPLTHARETLLEGLKEKDPDARADAVRGSGLAIADPAIYKAVMSMLDDGDLRVRTAAISALGLSQNPAVRPRLQKLLDDPVPEVAYAAGRALYLAGDLEGKGLLEDMYARERKATSGAVKNKTREMKRDFSTPTRAFLSTVKYGIGFMPVPGVGMGYAATQEMLGAVELSPRAAILLMFVGRNDPMAPQMAVQGLNDEDYSVRATAALSVARLRLKHNLPDLVRLMEDKKRQVQFTAAGAYVNVALGGPVAPLDAPKAAKSPLKR